MILKLSGLIIFTLSLCQSVALSQHISTIPADAPFVLEQRLAQDQPTLFVFYVSSSSAEADVVTNLKSVAQKSGKFALRLAPVTTLSSPAAQSYGVSETPTIMLLDRFGRLMIRTSKAEEIQPLLIKALKMARIKWVDEAEPAAAVSYKSMGGGKRPVAGILKTMSLRPELMEGINRIAGMAHFTNGFLPRKTKEMIATYVSAINHCKF